MNSPTNILLCLMATLPAAHATSVLVGDTSGDARGTNSVEIQSTRANGSQVAFGAEAVAIGTKNTADSYATAVGQINFAGLHSTAVGHSNHAESYSVAVGFANTAGSYNAALGVSNYVWPFESSDYAAVGAFNSIEAPGYAFGGYNNIYGGSDSAPSGAFGYGNQIEAVANGSFVFGSGITNATAGSTMIGPSDAAKVTILSSGNVGIGLGNTSPTEKLEVGGNAKINGTLTTTGALSPGGSINLASGQTITFANGGNPVSISSPGSSRMQFGVSGNAFEARQGGIMFPVGNRIMDQNANTMLAFGYASPAVNYVQIDNSIAGVAPTIRSAGSDMNVGLTLAPKGAGNTTIPSGNVGIGTSSPGNKLAVVQGTGSAAGFGLYTSSSYGPTIEMRADSGTANGSWFRIISTGVADAAGANKLVIRDQTSGALDRFTIAQNGNVGIGTTAPLGRADVLGGSHSQFGGRNVLGDDGNYNPTWKQYRWTGVDTSYYSSAFITTGDGSGGALFKFQVGSTMAPLGAEILSDVMALKGNGNVGIGTINPTSKLHVIGDANITGSITNPGIASTGSGVTSRLRVGGTANPSSAWQGTAVIGPDGQNKIITGYLTSSTNGAVIGAHNSALSAWADLNIAGSNLIFRSDQTERMRVTSTGNIGIGTSNPSAKLQVTTATNGLNFPLGLKNNDFTESGGNAVGIGFLNEGDVNGAWWKGAIVHERKGSYGIGSLHFLVNNAANNTAATLADARMTITKEGQVGIGTSSPSAINAGVGITKLDVVGAGGTNITVQDTSGYSSLISAGQTEGNLSLRDMGTTSGTQVWNLNSNNGTLSFRRLSDNQATVLNTPLAINSDNVGIGTTAPSAKLDVNGTAQFAGDIKVKNKAVIRVSAAGDIGMGSFTSGTNPEL